MTLQQHQRTDEQVQHNQTHKQASILPQFLLCVKIDSRSKCKICSGCSLENAYAGVILHPTSLPGPYGIGEIGKEAEKFVDWIASTGMQLWQVLPLVPPEEQYWSPYAGGIAILSAEQQYWFDTTVTCIMTLLCFTASTAVQRHVITTYACLVSAALLWLGGTGDMRCSHDGVHVGSLVLQAKMPCVATHC